MNLMSYLQSRGFNHFEGFSQQIPQQVYMLDKIIKSHNVKTVMEIGFNAGHSAEVILSASPDITLTSFDLGLHDYVSVGKNYIDNNFAFRHRLILGNSLETVPLFTNENPNVKFDLIFIDGGHLYETAKGDLMNCLKLAHDNTIVIVDDVVFTPGWEEEWTTGPTQVWLESINDNTIEEFGRIDFVSGRGMAWGKYLKRSN